jgi:hypothetical protein
MYTKDQILTLAKFFQISGIQVLPSFCAQRGTAGIIAYVNTPDGEQGIHLEYNVHPNSHEIPQSRTHDYSFDPQGLERIRECMDEPGWFPCDNPRLKQIGFVNYNKSEIRYFNLPNIKQALSYHPRLFQKLHEWCQQKQAEDDTNEFNQFSAKIIPWYTEELERFLLDPNDIYPADFSTEAEMEAYELGCNHILHLLGQPTLEEIEEALDNLEYPN